ncbi:MAG: dihydropteroate synthase [Actinobacteria bacterium HGW-Actinobacteria-4]|nr:MAG: dihydropteroate synthase [Actinobacteria bacterium HGW-Actinobacteria-4]
MSERTLVWGILNVTPDSFSDGGHFLAADAAIQQGLGLAAAGADVVDVGGESTRPGAARVDAGTEIERVLPVIEALASEGVTVSIDTMRGSTARAAVDAGARYVNDVSGGLADPDMARIVAELEVDYVAMHWRAHSATMDQHDVYDDVVAEVRDELLKRLQALTDAGVDGNRIILDPGLGFAKVGEHNWTLLAHLDELRHVGTRGQSQRVLIGASRKRFLGATIARSGEQQPPPEQRDHATTAVTALAAQAGAWAVRVHDVRAACDAIAVASAWRNASTGAR